MKRREFITLLGVAAAAAWPLRGKAQQRTSLRRIGVLLGLSPDDKEGQLRVEAFESAWPELGWVEGRNIHVDYRWAPGDMALMRTQALELVASAPEVILANGSSVLAALREATDSIPIVFLGVSDPEGAGVVKNLARPGGHMTGFTNFEPAMGGKWLQTLREIAPHITRVGMVRNPTTLPRLRQSIETEAASMGIEAVDCGVRGAADVKERISSFADQPHSGFIVLPDPVLLAHRRLMIELVATQRQPAVYPFRTYVDEGGLLTYGVDIQEQARRAAFYIDRILKGTSPGDLPVQAPTKFELIINLKTAKALGLAVPLTLLARADQIIE